MKKILMGLITLTSLSFAAGNVDLGGEAGPGKYLFLSSQEGAIKVTGAVTSNVPVVKYVIFASSDNGTTKLDTLELYNFIISTDTSVAGFERGNPKVYVKRVVGEGASATTEDLESADEVEFKVTLDSSWNGLIPQPWLAFSGTNSMECFPFNLLAKSTLLEVVTAVNGILGTHDLRLYEDRGHYGSFTVTGLGAYAGGKNVRFEVISNGVLEIKTGGDNPRNDLPSKYTDAINNQFAVEKSLPNTVDIKVRIK